MQQYLKQKIEPFLNQLFSHYLPDVQFRQIHDLFNAQKFHRFLLCILTQQIKNKINDLQLSTEDDVDQSYQLIKIKAFLKIFEIIQSGFQILGMNFKKRISVQEIEGMVKKNDLTILNYFLQYIFELFVHNQQLLVFITTLNVQIQTNIMQIVKNGQICNSAHKIQDFKSQHSINYLNISSKINFQIEKKNSFIHIQELQSTLQIKQEQIQEIKLEKQHFQEQNQELKKQLILKEKQLNQLRRRIQNCQNVELYLHENDQQLKQTKLKLKDNQSKFQTRLAEFIQEIKENELKFKLIEFDCSSKSSELQKFKSQLQKISMQKIESDNAKNIVIANLKEKKVQAQFRVQELQQQLQVVKNDRMQKQRELIGLKTSQAYHIQKSGFDNLISPRSPLRGEQFLQGIQSFRGNYSKLGQQVAFDLDKTDLQQDMAIISKSKSSKRFTEILQENYSLKHQIQLLQSTNLGETKQYKELESEIQKMKKKIVILKRRNDEIDNQRKEEVDILVGVMEQFYANSFQNVNKK